MDGWTLQKFCSSASQPALGNSSTITKCTNLSNDKEKWMSYEHISLLSLSRYSTIFARFTSLAMLSALSAIKFGMLYTVHVVLICITFFYSWKVKRNRVSSIPVLQDIWGPYWNNNAKQMLSLVLAVSSLYYFPENSGCDLSTDLIYYAIVFVEDFVAAFILVTVSKYYCLLYFSTILVLIIGFWILLKCDQLFRLDITSDGDENRSLPTSIPILTPVIYFFMSCIPKLWKAVYYLESTTTISSLIFRNNDQQTRPVHKQENEQFELEVIALPPIKSSAVAGGIYDLHLAPETFIPGSVVTTQLTSVNKKGTSVKNETPENTGLDADLSSLKYGYNSKWKKAMQAWKNKKRDEISGSVRQRPPPLNKIHDVQFPNQKEISYEVGNLMEEDKTKNSDCKEDFGCSDLHLLST